jgi:hypothetical protein
MSDVIHIRDKIGSSDEVYIGRGSKWGNPFKIGEHGTREEVIDKYKTYLAEKYDLLESLHELDGKTLVCYCKPKACHGDVLVELINKTERHK